MADAFLKYIDMFHLWKNDVKTENTVGAKSIANEISYLESFLQTEVLNPKYYFQHYDLTYSDRAFKAIHLESRVSLEINFDQDKNNYFRKNTQGKKDIFIKALGIKKNDEKVLDLTAGLGRDSVYLASQKVNVVSIERDPLIYFLLRSAQLLTQRDDLNLIQFVFGDASDFCQQNSLQDYSAIYYDPMYPEVSVTSALPKKEIQFLRRHLGSDFDHVDILLKLLQILQKKTWSTGSIKPRLVVKRHPSFKSEIIPDLSFEGKSVRYDVFLPSGKYAKKDL